MSHEAALTRVVKMLEHEDKKSKFIIFTPTRDDARNLERMLVVHGVQVVSLHGGREQREREYAYHQMRTGSVAVPALRGKGSVVTEPSAVSSPPRSVAAVSTGT